MKDTAVILKSIFPLATHVGTIFPKLARWPTSRHGAQIQNAIMYKSLFDALKEIHAD